MTLHGIMTMDHHRYALDVAQRWAHGRGHDQSEPVGRYRVQQHDSRRLGRVWGIFYIDGSGNQ